MKVVTGLLLALLVCLPAMAGDDTGDLQVTCWPGYRVYLDDTFAGLTTVEEDGRYLRNVAAGEHTVRVEKLGHEPTTMTVQVPPGEAVEVRVDGIVAAPEVVPSESASPTPVGESAAPEVAVPAATTAMAVAAVVRPPASSEASPSTTAVPEPAAAPPEVTPEPAAVAGIAAAGEEPRPSSAEVLLPAGGPVVVPRVIEVQDVMFAYRVRGAALDGESTVAITRERGGPRAPVMAFLCHDPGECYGQTKATFPFGSYRFRVTFRAGKGTTFKHDVYLELAAEPGRTYLLDVRFDALEETACTVVAVDATAP